MKETLLPTPLVTPSALAEALRGPDAGRIVVVDVTGRSAGSPHIPGALPFDLDGPMSDHTSGLPHTMPSVGDFQRELRHLGINDDSHVVVTEDDFLFAAARPWWMLHACGFDSVSILDGGNPGWRSAGGAMTTEATTAPEPGNVTLHEVPGAFCSEQEVIDIVEGDRGRSTPQIVDARSADRFAGRVAEPRPGLRSGHMPTAANLPYTEIVRDGQVRPVQELRILIDGIVGDRPIVTTCGSGVTACVVALAAVLAGRQNVSVYDGSWSEWGREGGPRVVTD